MEGHAMRARARCVAGVLFVGIPCAVAFVPVPFGVVTQAIVSAEAEHHVRVETPGQLVSVAPVGPRSIVDAGTSIATLSNPICLS